MPGEGDQVPGRHGAGQEDPGRDPGPVAPVGPPQAGDRPSDAPILGPACAIVIFLFAGSLTIPSREAISFCVPIASIETMAPLRASMSNSSGIAVISLDFPSAARCASASPASVA